MELQANKVSLKRHILNNNRLLIKQKMETLHLYIYEFVWDLCCRARPKTVWFERPPLFLEPWVQVSLWTQVSVSLNRNSIFKDRKKKDILQLQLCISYPCFQIKNKTSSSESGAPGYKTTCQFSGAAASIISPNHQYSSPSVFDGDPPARLRRMESYRRKQTGPRYRKTG